MAKLDEITKELIDGVLAIIAFLLIATLGILYVLGRMLYRLIPVIVSVLVVILLLKLFGVL